MYKYKKIALVVGMTVLLTACTPHMDAETEPVQPEVVQESQVPAAGGSFTMSVTRFNTINPLFNNETSLKQLHNLIYEGLVAFNEELDMEPVLAESWILSPDGQSIDFVLRKNVHWHDGTPFTAEDVIFTYQVIKGNLQGIQNTSIYQMSLQQISDMRVIDNGNLRVTFSRPFSHGLEVMAFPILPQHLFNTSNLEQLTNQDFPIVGTGPYAVESHQSMKELILKRNTQYWGQVPYVDEIQVQIVPDREAQISLFENGSLDFAQPISIDWDRFSDDSNTNVYEFTDNQYEFIGFNFKNPLLQDKNVRKAIAFGLDRHSIVNNIYLGHGTVVDVPIHPDSWLYDTASLQYGYDPQRADALLTQQGYQWNEAGDGRIDGENQPIALKLIANQDNALREKTAFFIQEQLAEVGIDVEISFLEWEAFNEALSTGNFDLVLAGWELSVIPDLSFAFHSTQQDRLNFIKYSDETMDQLLEEAFRAPSRESKLEAYHSLQAYLSDELPYLSLMYQNSGLMVKDKLKGVSGGTNQNLFANINSWYIETK